MECQAEHENEGLLLEDIGRLLGDVRASARFAALCINSSEIFAEQVFLHSLRCLSQAEDLNLVAANIFFCPRFFPRMSNDIPSTDCMWQRWCMGFCCLLRLRVIEIRSKTAPVARSRTAELSTIPQPVSAEGAGRDTIQAL